MGGGGPKPLFSKCPLLCRVRCTGESDPDFVAAEPIETALADDLEEGVEAFKPGRMTRHYVIYLIT